MSSNDLIQVIEPDAADPRIQAAVAELRALIAARYPEAAFSIFHGDEPDGIYLRVVIDVADLDGVTDLYMDRLVDLQVEGGLPVYVALDWPLTRVQEQVRRKVAQPFETRLPVTWS